MVNVYRQRILAAVFTVLIALWLNYADMMRFGNTDIEFAFKYGVTHLSLFWVGLILYWPVLKLTQLRSRALRIGLFWVPMTVMGTVTGFLLCLFVKFWVDFQHLTGRW
jgi:hypothetical protein